MCLKINFVFLLIYVLKVSTVESAEKTVGLRHILSKDDHKKLKEFVDETVNSTSDILSIPSILQPSTTPSKFLKEESTDSTHQVYKKTFNYNKKVPPFWGCIPTGNRITEIVS
jgi:hypothetical protein